MELPHHIEKKISRVPFSGCWAWMGATANGEYGLQQFKGKLRLAHRVVLELSGVDVPADKVVMHICDVRCCVNPHHLAVGTAKDNMADMYQKGRARPPKGDAHWTRRDPVRGRLHGLGSIEQARSNGFNGKHPGVTSDVMRQIREAHLTNPKRSMKALGEPYGINWNTVTKIVKRISPWHID